MSRKQELVAELVWQVRRSFRELAAAADRRLAPLGIAGSERALMEFLARAEGPVSLSEVARQQSVSKQHVHQSLQRLNADWVEREPDPADARSVLVRLSRGGRALWNRVRATDEQFAGELAPHFTEQELRLAVDVLRRLRERLAEEADDAG